MKRVLMAVGAVIAYVVSCAVVPPRIDRKRNQVYGPPRLHASPAAQSLVNRMLIADLHADSLIWDRDLLRRNDRGQVDMPRLQQANVAIQLFSVPTKVPRKISSRTSGNQLNLLTVAAILGGWPPQTWYSLTHRALFMSRRLEHFAEKSGAELCVVRNREELDRFIQSRGTSHRVAGILAIEGLHALDGNLDRLDALFDHGYRVMGLVHQFDNQLGGSSTGVDKGGLTAFGREAMRRMEARSIIIDLAHASPQLIRDVTASATRPVIVSHTGVRGTCDRARNISDEEIRMIAGTGGVIGIGYWSGATCGSDARAVARAIRHAVSVAGVDHVSLGSDFDGDRMPFDVTGIPQVIDALIEEGFSQDEVEKIAGGNVLRVLRNGLPPH